MILLGRELLVALLEAVLKPDSHVARVLIVVSVATRLALVEGVKSARVSRKGVSSRGSRTVARSTARAAVEKATRATPAYLIKFMLTVGVDVPEDKSL